MRRVPQQIYESMARQRDSYKKLRDHYMRKQMPDLAKHFDKEYKLMQQKIRAAIKDPTMVFDDRVLDMVKG